MATVLPFVIRRRAPSAVRPGDHRASIIIFPGVRYESVDGGGGNGRPSNAGAASRKRKGKSS